MNLYKACRDCGTEVPIESNEEQCDECRGPGGAKTVDDYIGAME